MTAIHALTQALLPTHGIRAAALAKAYDRFCVHHDRARFNAEVQAIRSCVLVDFIEHASPASLGLMGVR